MLNTGLTTNSSPNGLGQGLCSVRLVKLRHRLPDKQVLFLLVCKNRHSTQDFQTGLEVCGMVYQAADIPPCVMHVQVLELLWACLFHKELDSDSGSACLFHTDLDIDLGSEGSFLKHGSAQDPK